MNNRGVSLLELVVVLAVVALVATMVPILAPPSGVARLARDVQALMLAARLEAIAGDHPVAVVWHGAENTFEVRSAGANSTVPEACTGRVSQRLRVGSYPRTAVVRSLRDQVVWLPVGLGRSCTGGAVFNGTIEIRGGRQARRVILSSGGRVRIEVAP